MQGWGTLFRSGGRPDECRTMKQFNCYSLGSIRCKRLRTSHRLDPRFVAMSRSSLHHRPRKAKLGQNFLVSPTAPRAIVDALGDIGNAAVLEIGPGRGIITHLLASRSKYLVAVEVDRSLASALQMEFERESGTGPQILCQDILSADLTELASRFGGRLKVVGNLPYYITSDILLHLFAHHAIIEQAVLTVQREVADRIMAVPGNRDYGLLSATTQMYAQAQRLFDLPPGAFSPPPEVHSTVFRLTMQPRFLELGVDEEKFLHFLRQVFAQKRKTLANNLRAAGYEAAAIQAALHSRSDSPLNSKIRAEAVSLESMASIFQELEKKRGR
jgi:16S rRNA (adenine1518-N6/adenine1519-N6)-dimethyltransferase